MKYYLKFCGQEEKEVTRVEYLAASGNKLDMPISHTPIMFKNKDATGRLLDYTNEILEGEPT
jgi:hypothetical protein